jgi:Ala-tRNA(Pro) deacylase
MVTIAKRLKDTFDAQSIRYELIAHPRDYTAQETAAHTHTPGPEFAKSVFVRADGEDIMAVLPAHHKIDMEKLRQALGATHLELADETHIKELCPDCDVGAAPPFGNLYDLPVVLSKSMEKDETITFNAGSHEDAIRIRLSDYRRLVQPRVAAFSRLAD